MTTPSHKEHKWKLWHFSNPSTKLNHPEDGGITFL